MGLENKRQAASWNTDHLSTAVVLTATYAQSPWSGPFQASPDFDPDSRRTNMINPSMSLSNMSQVSVSEEIEHIALDWFGNCQESNASLTVK